LGNIEETAKSLPQIALGYGKNLAGSAAAAFPNANAAIWSFVQAAGAILSTNATKPLAERFGTPDVGGMLAETALDMRKRATQIGKDLAPDTSGMGTVERGINSGVQSAATSLMMLPLSLGTGSPVPMLAGLSGITAGQSLGEATDKGLPLNEALIHATKQGLIEYGTELFPVGNLLKNLTAKTGLIKTATQFMIREGIGEQAATVLQDLDKWATLNPEKPFSEYLAERPEAALETLIATAVGGSIQVGGAKAVAKGIETMQRASTVDLGRAHRAEENHGILMGLGEKAAGHPLRERDPQAFHDFMSTMTEDGNLSDVYVDGKTLANVLNQSGVSEQEIQRKMPEVAQQLGEAAKTNGEVRISLADYATYVAGTDVEKGIIDHLRASPDGMTYTEAQQFYQGQKDDLSKQAEKIMADANTTDAYKQDVQQVHDTILEQMNKAGRFTADVNAAYAVPFREFYAVNAAKMGITPSELYKRLPLNFAPMNAGNILNQGDDQINTPEFKEWFGDSRVVDEDGKPLVVYHGTKQQFSDFSREKIADDEEYGFFFASNPEAANEYAGDSRREGGNVMPVYLAIQNPYTVSNNQWSNAEGLSPKEAEAQGYDGYIISGMNRGSDKSDTYIAFDPTQIKSAIGNSGKFNPNDPNILNQSVFHGTPHVWAPEPGFPHGRPRLDKMGTGEGAAAFGWGWYSAENQGVAREYRDILSDSTDFFTVDGEVQFKGPANGSDPRQLAISVLAHGDTIEAVKERLEDNDADPVWVKQFVAEGKKLEGKKVEIKTDTTGNLYSLDIPDSVLPRLLDWDKPLSEQTPEVRKALLKAMPELRDQAAKQDREDADLLAELLGEPAEINPNVQLPTTSAQDFYHSLVRKHGGDKAASEYLASIGIVGNRYLDGGSRADGKGTYNYVIWDQPTLDKVALLERNGEKLDAMRELAQGNRAGYNPDTFTISLLKGADLSSTLHEGGHFYLEALAEMAGRPDAPQQIKDDFRKTLDWFGITGNENLEAGTRGGDLGQSTTTQQRAEAAGFDTSTVWLHGTTKNFKSFKPGDNGVNELGKGVYFTTSPTETYFHSRGENGRVVEAYIKKGDMFDLSVMRDTGQMIGGRA
jgi:hypothetical protein